MKKEESMKLIWELLSWWAKWPIGLLIFFFFKFNNWLLINLLTEWPCDLWHMMVDNLPANISLPLLGIGALSLILSLIFCCYMWRWVKKPQCYQVVPLLQQTMHNVKAQFFFLPNAWQEEEVSVGLLNKTLDIPAGEVFRSYICT